MPTLKVSNLTGPASMAHIHRGSVGENGPVLIGLTTEDGGSTWTIAADAPVLSVDEIEAFKNGELYFNVHTMVNTPGELRGQIDPENALKKYRRFGSSVKKLFVPGTLLRLVIVAGGLL